MKVKLKTATVHKGSVWPVDSVLDVDDKTARQMIEDGKAVDAGVLQAGGSPKSDFPPSDLSEDKGKKGK